MTLLISTKAGYGANGSLIEYYVVSNKRTAREIDTKEQVLEYIKAYLNNDWDKCVTIGKLVSVLSEK